MDIDRALISRIVLDNAMVDAIDSNVQEALFEGECKAIWKWCQQHFTRYATSPGMQALAHSFPDFVVDKPTEGVAVYADMLRRRYAYNSQIEAMKVVHAKLRDGADALDTLDEFRAMVMEVEEVSAMESDLDWTRDGDLRIAKYERVKEMGGVDGVRTLFPTFDLYTGGWQPEDLILAVARQGIGKTWLEVFLAEFHHANGGSPILFSKEMAAFQIARRMDAARFKLSYKNLRRGILDTTEEERWREGLEGLKAQAPFKIIGEPGRGVSFIASKAIRYRPTMIFIDGMYLMEDESESDQNWQRITNIARSLKKLAKKLKIPIFATVQFSKGGKTADDIAYADIAKECDVLMALYQNEDQRLGRLMEMKLLKNREGDVYSQEVRWNLDSMDIGELGTGNAVVEDADGTADF